MNKHITRIILASTSFALSSLINVASGQVLGGGLGGAVGGGFNTISGTVNGTGSLGGAFDANSAIDRSHGSVNRVRGVTRDTGGRLRERAKSTAGAVKNETQGGASDLKESAAAISTVPQEESSALASAAAGSASAAADVAGGLDTQAKTPELTKTDSSVAPSLDPIESHSPDNAPSQPSSLAPQGLDSGALTSGGSDSTPTQPATREPRVSGSAEANGNAEASVI